jgi:hypothetical protein
VNSFDGASPQDQKQDQMKDQETAPDQQVLGIIFRKKD